MARNKAARSSASLFNRTAQWQSDQPFPSTHLPLSAAKSALSTDTRAQIDLPFPSTHLPPSQQSNRSTYPLLDSKFGPFSLLPTVCFVHSNRLINRLLRTACFVHSNHLLRTTCSVCSFLLLAPLRSIARPRALIGLEASFLCPQCARVRQIASWC